MDKITFQDKVIKLLNCNAYGIRRAMPRAQILEQLQAQGAHIDDRQMRNWIQEIAPENLIAPSEDGYFIISCESDYNAAVHQYESRIIALAAKKNATRDAFIKKFNKDPQLTLI